MTTAELPTNMISPTHPWQDWYQDCAGKQHLGGGDFFRCWFELADLNTNGVGAEEYVKFITDLSGLIFDPNGGYLDEKDMLERVRDAAYLRSHEYARRVRSWCGHFDIPEAPFQLPHPDLAHVADEEQSRTPPGRVAKAQARAKGRRRNSSTSSKTPCLRCDRPICSNREVLMPPLAKPQFQGGGAELII
eukprot:6886046-Prymnesium_polylepis.1